MIDKSYFSYEALESGKVRRARYFMMPIGMAADSVHLITVDSKYLLRQSHPGNDLCLCPVAPNPQPNYSTVLFYADCLSYCHDIPIMVSPSSQDLRSFGYSYLNVVGQGGCDRSNGRYRIASPTKPRRSRDWPMRTWLVRDIAQSYELAREIRHGPLSYVLFKNNPTDDVVNLSLTELLGHLVKEVNLYACAVRQNDFLSEYLHYYRIIEAVAGRRHKAWIRTTLSEVRRHDFGFIAFCDASSREQPPRNLMSIIRRRALSRLSVLRKAYGSDDGVATYLYNTVRCGIAHAHETMIPGKLSKSYFDVAKDCYVMKLLARMAIESRKP